MNVAALDRLCAACGIATEYRDVWLRTHSVPVETRRALLAAMGVAAGSDAEIAAALEERETRGWRRVLPPVRVVRSDAGALVVPVTLPAAGLGQHSEWVLTEEGGARHTGVIEWAELARSAERRVAGARFARFELALPVMPAAGYHRFEIVAAGGPRPPAASMTLIVAPPRCYLPAVLEQGRVWGPMVNLPSLRSRRNWGVGDYTDLRSLVELCARNGAGTVGVLPLHALFPHDPEHASPYSPASRRQLNVMLLDPEAIPEFAECDAARERFSAAEFQARLSALRAAEQLDCRAIAELKLPVLELLHAHFLERHLAPGTHRARSFRAFQQESGEPLRLCSLFCALQEHLARHDAGARGWRGWPEQYRDPRSEAVAAFARAHPERVEYYDYLQWNAELQLDAAGKRSLELGLAVGVYQDLAVGADPGGPEAWAHQQLYARGATIGCPPDEFNLKGQDWGLPPPLPERLVETAYAPFAELLRCNMRHAGALRIDHVLGLMRLFWVPEGEPPARGGYVSYPFDDLLAILALESQRNRCLVVGEDLGTLPEGLGERLDAAGVLSYRLLYFEREAGGAFKPPGRYPARALAAVSTHDLPTLRGFWQGRDLDLRNTLKLYPGEEQRQRQVVERAQDRARLLVALEAEKLLPADITAHTVSAPAMTPALAAAVHRYLARTPCRLCTVQPEDIFGQLDQLNLPATTRSQYPGWRSRPALELERWEADERFRAFAAALNEERPPPAARPSVLPRRAHVTRIPDATYRLQFSRAFTFEQATALVPYLHRLGVSHCYSSPLFSARPGSRHGYDIVDHNALNPEIGGAEAFDRFTRELRSFGMGLVLDVVPNHMGVMGADNAWWLDVLENGQASVYAGFFDIDWQPADFVLAGKVLLPVLGNHYGVVLEQGELTLAFDPGRGEFSVRYHQHRFPVDPGSYGRILERALQLAPAHDLPPAARDELESLISAFGHLPAREETAAGKRAERHRDKEVHKKRLALLVAGHPAVATGVGTAIGVVNGTPGQRASLDALHELLEAQSYRLAYWRVASDQINYRRFFDINDLAALRMEDEAVFEATHRLAFDLVADGRVEGLRIDHPDGLYDPVGYFRRLQERCAPAAPPPQGPRGLPLYLVAEKITAGHERLPGNWPIHGTTGYRYANVVNGLFVDARAKHRMDRTYRAFAGEVLEFDELAYQARHLIMRTALASELTVLSNHLARIAQADRHTRDFTLTALRQALSEVAASFPVYRTYIDERVRADDRRYIEWAVARARRRSQAADVSIYEFVQSALLGRAVDGADSELGRLAHEFARKFQQFTSPVAAKGVEDTAFYRYHRLVSLNEVGGDPDDFGFTIGAFHGANRDRAKNWPHTLLTTSTHDSKRSEDVRARINALSEMPAAWRLEARRWSRLNRNRKRRLDGDEAPSRNDEYLLYQTLVGTWPPEELDDAGRARYCERIEGYMLKAAREAKVLTSWVNHNVEYESALTEFVRGLLLSGAGAPFRDRLGAFAAQVARIGRVNSLSQLVLKITSPGVPDFYQGSELWALDLVDPDNRRPVDFGRRCALLDELQAQFEGEPGRRLERARHLLDDMADGRVKLYVTWRGLRLRRSHGRLFTAGEYLALDTAGVHAQRICAFARTDGDAASVTLAPRLIAGLPTGSAPPLGRAAWGDTRVLLPPRLARRYRNAFTEEELACDDAAAIDVAAVLAHFPVAILASSVQT